MNGDWVVSDLAIGIAAPFDLNVGTTFDGNDPLFDSTADSIPARIAALVVRGQIMGSATNFLDFPVIQAEQFGSIKVGATKFPTPAPGSAVYFGSFSDMLLQTVAL